MSQQVFVLILILLEGTLLVTDKSVKDTTKVGLNPYSIGRYFAGLAFTLFVCLIGVLILILLEGTLLVPVYGVWKLFHLLVLILILLEGTLLD